MKNRLIGFIPTMLLGTALSLLSLPAMAAGINVLANLTGTATGANSYAGLLDVNGILYGTAANGGTNGDGSVFSYNLSTGSINQIVAFNGTNGHFPVAGLTDINGTLYGATQSGGAYGGGVIYSLNPSNGTMTNLVNFNGGGNNGAAPSMRMNDIGGLLYGTTTTGGANGVGTLFSFNPGTNGLATLANFSTSTTGGNPYDAPIDINGVLYGTTSNGGKYQEGAIFSYNMSTGVLADISNFNTATGTGPLNRVSYINGNLYGTTQFGGANGEGTVYSFNLATGQLLAMMSFVGPNGDTSYSGLLNVSNMLYGVTAYGGANNDGTLFAVDPATGGSVTLASFSGSNGIYPNSAPIDIGGVLYSDTSKGGSVGDGIVYSYTAPTTQQLAQDIPEPSSFACLAIGVGILGLMYSFFIKKKNVTN